MNVEELKRSLNYTKKKHQDDRLFTGQTNIAMMCEDVLNTISEMESEIEQLKEENQNLRHKISELEQPCKSTHELSEFSNNSFGGKI